MYTITTTPGDHVATARRSQMPWQRWLLSSPPNYPGPVAWCITDPSGTKHRGRDALNGRLDYSPSLSTNSSTSCTPHCTGQPTASASNFPNARLGAAGLLLQEALASSEANADCRRSSVMLVER